MRRFRDRGRLTERIRRGMLFGMLIGGGTGLLTGRVFLFLALGMAAGMGAGRYLDIRAEAASGPPKTGTQDGGPGES